MTALLQVSKLDLQVGGRCLLRGLNLAVDAGQCWVVLGRNGCGKTRLLHTLAGLLRPSTGAIALQGSDLNALSARERARRLGLLLQHSDPGMHATTQQLVLGGSFARRSGWEDRQDLARADRALQAVGLPDESERLASSLSGGELRRAEIARLLVQAPVLAMLDEPINHLDLGQQVATLELLIEHFVGPGSALLLVLHDVGLALRAATHLLLLHGDGQWQAGEVGELGEGRLLSRLFGYPLREYRDDEETIVAADLSRARLRPAD